MVRRSTATQVPPTLLELRGLGIPRQYFPRIQQPGRFLQLAAWAACFIAAALFGYAGFTAYQQWSHFGVAASGRDATRLSLFGVLFLTATLVVWLLHRQRSAGGVMVYQHGLAIDVSDETRQWRWDAWKSLTVDSQQNQFLGLVRTKKLRCWLVDERGEAVMLDESLNGIQDLCLMLEQNILPHLLRVAEQKYRAGEALQFGPIQIQREAGLAFGNQQMPWSSIRQLEVREGYLEIQHKQDGLHDFRVPAARLPNLPILLALCGGHSGVRVQTRVPG